MQMCKKIRLDAEYILSTGNWKAWFGRINEFIHRSPPLPAARLPTFIYANFTITKGEELRGLFNKPVISDNISNGFHGSGEENADELKVHIWALHHNHVSHHEDYSRIAVSARQN